MGNHTPYLLIRRLLVVIQKVFGTGGADTAGTPSAKMVMGLNVLMNYEENKP